MSNSNREEFEDRDGVGLPYEGDPGDEQGCVGFKDERGFVWLDEHGNELARSPLTANASASLIGQPLPWRLIRGGQG